MMNAHRTFLTRSLPVVLPMALVLPAGMWWAAAKAKAEVQPSNAPQALPQVEVVLLAKQPLRVVREYSARLESTQEVKLKPQVSGVIKSIHFQAGSLVKAGDLLVSLDTSTLAAIADKAAGEQEAARARWVFSQLDLARVESLVAEHAVPRRELEEKRRDEQEAKAGVDAAEAALRLARVNLGHAQVRAPIAGRISNAYLTVGNVIEAGVNAPVLASIVSQSPIYAGFQMDEDTFVKEVANMPGEKEVTLASSASDKSDFTRRGVIADIDNKFDTATSSIRIRAAFDNAQGQLIPGLVTRLRFTGQARQALLLPQSAVAMDQSKEFVLKIDKTDTLVRQEVTLGPEVQPGYRLVLAGAAEGDRVVAGGLAQVRAGMKVLPRIPSSSSKL